MRSRDIESGSWFWIKAILVTIIVVIVYQYTNSKIDPPDLMKSDVAASDKAALIITNTSGVLNLNDLSSNERKNYTGKGEYVFLFKTKRYKGDWVNGLPSGNGEMWYSNGDYCLGEFHNGVLDGEAIMNFNSGSLYSGDFVKNKRHGYGKMVYPNGAIQEGFWQRDKFLGATM